MTRSDRSRTGAEAPEHGPVLSELVAGIGHAPGPGAGSPGGSPRITGIETRSDAVVPGSLFVAIRGTRVDGHDFIGEAVERGAAAVVVESTFTEETGVPTVRVPDSRRALAELAAQWHGRPAERLQLVGITGSLGKTSTLAMLEAILSEAGASAGTVGSLGVHMNGEAVRGSHHTAPDPLFLHRELARLVEEGSRLVAMEVTSHALVQERVHGLLYDVGVFTNLVPLEHSEYHPTFREYAAAKGLFFRHLRPSAPLVYNIDDLVVRRMVHDAEAEPVGCGVGPAASVRRQDVETDSSGSRFELVVRRPIPAADAGEVPPTRFPVELRLLGRSNADNATLAAATALCLGIAPDAVQRGLAGLDPQPRRLEILHRDRFTVLDDTVGHPDSVSAVFQVVEQLAPRRVHAVFAVRGQRGPRVNRHAVTTLAVWSRRIPLETLLLTSSVDSADDRNRVEREEREACEEALRENGVPFTTEERLDAAVETALEAARDGDLVLLLGAQGMDDGREILRRWLEGRN